MHYILRCPNEVGESSEFLPNHRWNQARSQTGAGGGSAPSEV